MKIKFPYLEDYQKAVIEAYQHHPKNTTVIINSPRQCGKSVTMLNLLLYASMSSDNAVSISVAPISAQTRKNFEDLVKMSLPLIKKYNSSLLEIEYRNGSKVLFKSAESGDNLRGLTVKKTGILCIDEFAYIKKDFYYSVLLPMVNVFSSSVFGFSTPRTKEGIFFELYVKGINEEPGFITIDWTNYDLSKYLPDSLLARYESIMPKQAFLNEYKAQFNDSDGMVFTCFKDCVSSTALNISEPLYIGIDLCSGVGKDYTVLTYGQVYNNSAHILKQDAFNDKTSVQTIEYLNSIINKYYNLGLKDIILVVETNNMGHSMIQFMIDKIDCPAVSFSPFTTTAKSKNKIIQQLQLCFEQHKISIPDDQKLLSELALFSCTINNNGHALFSAPAGSHDDRVMSLCFCIDRMYVDLF